MVNVESDLETEVIIVGSGLSALTCAYRLTQEGIKVLIIEANSYIGGRTKSIKLSDGELVSVGGTWCSSYDWHLIALALELNCLPFIPKLDCNIKGFETVLSHPYMLLKLWLLGKQMSGNRSDYWKSKDADKYDNMSLLDWLNQQTSIFSDKKSKKAVRDWFLLMEDLPHDLSKLSTLFASVMIYQRLASIAELKIPKFYRWEGGTGIFIEAIKKKLIETNLITFVLDSPVKQIEEHNDSMLVMSNKIKARGKYVIVATPMPSINLINFIPPLKENHQMLNKSIQPWEDCAVNVILVFKKNWKPGLILVPPTDNFSSTGIFGAVMNLSLINGEKGIFRILIDSSRTKGLSEEQIKEQCLSYIVSFYPREKEMILHNFLYMLIHDWSSQKPWISSPSFYYPPDGTLTKYGDCLIENENAIYFSSAERSSSRGPHWMEGAVFRANTVSSEILQKMNKVKDSKEYLIDLENKTKKEINKLAKHDIKSWFQTLFYFLILVFKIIMNLLKISLKTLIFKKLI